MAWPITSVAGKRFFEPHYGTAAAGGKQGSLISGDPNRHVSFDPASSEAEPLAEETPRFDVIVVAIWERSGQAVGARGELSLLRRQQDLDERAVDIFIAADDMTGRQRIVMTLDA